MSGKARLMLALAVASFATAGLRFVPSWNVAQNVIDFAFGLGVGLMIGVLVTWAGERDPS